MKTKLHLGRLIPLMLSFIIFSATLAEANPRPDIYIFSVSERQDLVKLIMDYICTGQPEFNGATPNEHHANEICNIHTFGCGPQEECSGVSGTVNVNFLPWHREFIGNLENYLMANGGSAFVPLPKWDPCTNIPPEFMGQDATCGNLDPPETNSPNCGDFDSDIYDCEELCEFPSFCNFSITLEQDHNSIHNLTGGAMTNPNLSAGTAIFYIWHAYVDEVWYNYQVATMDDDISFEIEEVSVDPCGVNHYRVKAVDCLTSVQWTVNGVGVNIINQSQSGGFYNFQFEFQDGGSCSFSIDAVLTSSCSNTKTLSLDAKKSPCAAAVLSDINGNPLTSVCFGEDIYLDASASMNYKDYFVSIRERDAQGNAINYARFDNPKWRPGAVPSPFNLSKDIASGTWAYTLAPPSDWAFCPGGFYEVQFAVRNWCDTWEEVTIPFTVGNCADPVIEVVEEDCGSATVRVEFSENWVTGGPLFEATFPGVITSQYYQDGYYYAVVTSSQTGFVPVSWTVTTPCGQTSIGSSVYVFPGLPTLPLVPPFELEYICYGEPHDTYCFDFKNIPLLTGLMTGPPDPKLGVDINGTEICLGAITDEPFTTTLYIWPSGECGNGGIQEWTIHVNDPDHCDKQEPPRIISDTNNKSQEYQMRSFVKNNFTPGTQYNISENRGFDIYPNPFKEALNIKEISTDGKSGLSIKIFNATGKLMIESNQLDQSINTGILTTGIYFVSILDKNGQVVYSEKLIKVN